MVEVGREPGNSLATGQRRSVSRIPGRARPEPGWRACPNPAAGLALRQMGDPPRVPACLWVNSMRRGFCVVVLIIALFGVATLFAGATSDLRIDTKRDEKRNTTYLLKNIGKRTIEAKVEMLKDCTGSRRKPITRTFWVGPGQEVKLARAWADTSCRHDYRVVEAHYR